jgi:site-specific recombinase XerD
LPEPAKRAIDTYLLKSGRAHTIKPEDAIFVSMTTGKPLSYDGIYYNLKRYARAAGLDERHVNLHMFRHTASRERYQAGSDIRSIQQLLRHQSLATTDLYLRALVSQSDTGAKLLEDKYGHFS